MSSELITEDVHAATQIATAEIDQAIATAKRYPRDLKGVLQEAEMMATIDDETAASMFYVLKRKKFNKETKQYEDSLIEGPSTRLAEIFASSYGNLRVGSRIVSTGATHLTAQGICYDVEKNVSASVEIERRITYSDGNRYNDDMITTTANAASSVARRNAIFTVIPRTFVNAIVAKAQKAVKGNVKSIVEARDKCMAYFRKLGVDDLRVFEFVGKKEIVELTADDLVTLRAVASAIKAGEQSIEDVFAVEAAESPQDVTDQSPGDEPPDIDWTWFADHLGTIMAEKPLDDLRKELIELHPHQRQDIFDKCEEHREIIREVAKGGDA